MVEEYPPPSPRPAKIPPSKKMGVGMTSVVACTGICWRSKRGREDKPSPSRPFFQDLSKHIQELHEENKKLQEENKRMQEASKIRPAEPTVHPQPQPQPQLTENQRRWWEHDERVLRDIAKKCENQFVPKVAKPKAKQAFLAFIKKTV